jgi:predicted RNA binding protein YcfA (HicA-like mRNA interferase family)
MMGFYLRRQEGSHLILRRDDPFAQLVVLITRNSTGALFVPLSDRLVSA